jgi:hypothetical protein
MSIGGVKTFVNRAKGLRFDGNRLVVVFRDGREVHIPLRLYPSLLKATSAQRAHWIMIGPGKGFHWPDLDLDLSVDALVLGLRESVPTPSRAKTRRSA